MSLDLRLAPPAVACWLACGVLVAVPQASGWTAATLWAAAVGCAGALFGRNRTDRSEPGASARRFAGGGSRWAGSGWVGVLCVSLAASALAATAVGVQASERRPDVLVLATGGGRVVTATIRVDSTPTIAAASGPAGAETSRRQFAGTMTDVLGADRRFTLSAPVLVFLPQRDIARAPGSDALRIGSTLHLRATLRALPQGESTSFLVFGIGRPADVRAPPAWLGWSADLRSGFAKAASALPGDGGALLPGLAIGDVSAVSPQLNANMKASSLSHLTAVSGANCAVIVAAVMLVGGALGLRRGVRIGVSLVALVSFVVLVTPSASVLRAALMAVIVLVSAGAGRPGRGLPALALAVIGLLVADPWMSSNYGFALSVLATGGLLVLAAPLATTLTRWLPRPLALLIAIPLAAQLACQPVLILLNPAVPLYGVAANMLAEPAAPVATVLGLLSCVLLPWLPGLGFACAQLAWLPSAWIAAVANLTVQLPGSALPWPEGVLGLAMLVLLTTLVVIVVMVGSARSSPGRRGRQAVAVAGVLLIVFCGGYGGTLIGGGVGRSLAMPGDWQIAACDIGQGDAVLVRSGDLHALVDVGPDPVPLGACLHTLGVARIDLLVLSHYDLDHVGGLDAVVGKVGVALVGPPEGAQDQRRIDALSGGGADVRRATAGDHGTLGDLDWRILWPTPGSPMQTGNDGCVTIEFAGAGIRSVFLCDLGEGPQNAVLATGAVRPVDVVKVAHHGSADQSESMYRALGATLGVISVGADNTYGHPTARLLGILARVRTQPLRTDLQGLVLIAPARGAPGGMTVWTERQADAARLQQPEHPRGDATGNRVGGGG
jgi:competence protein ComEC